MTPKSAPTWCMPPVLDRTTADGQQLKTTTKLLGREKKMSRDPSYFSLAPRRAVASFENLVALANHEERLKEARKIVWRDRGEPAAELKDIWQCVEHAGRGGLRAHICQTSVHSSMLTHSSQELALSPLPSGPASTLSWLRFGLAEYQSKASYLLRPSANSNHLLSFREMRFALVRRALFGEDSFRFASMLGMSFQLVFVRRLYISCQVPLSHYTRRSLMYFPSSSLSHHQALYHPHWKKTRRKNPPPQLPWKYPCRNDNRDCLILHEHTNSGYARRHANGTRSSLVLLPVAQPSCLRNRHGG